MGFGSAASASCSSWLSRQWPLRRCFASVAFTSVGVASAWLVDSSGAASPEVSSAFIACHAGRRIPIRSSSRAKMVTAMAIAPVMKMPHHSRG